MSKQTLHSWITKAKGGTLIAASASKASQPALEAQVRQLKQTLARAEMERDILKKATAYFAKYSLVRIHESPSISISDYTHE